MFKENVKEEENTTVFSYHIKKGEMAQVYITDTIQ